MLTAAFLILCAMFGAAIAVIVGQRWALTRLRRRLATARAATARWRNRARHHRAAADQFAELANLPTPMDPWAGAAEAERAYQDALLAHALSTDARRLYHHLEDR